MQSHLHHQHQQQQLVALLSSALPAVTPNTPDQDRSPPKPEVESTTDQDRASALDSLRRAIVYPPNSLLVHHSASFLFQGISQLLTDRSHAVRRRAAVAHGALCAVECSLNNGLQTGTTVVSELPDLFINWALPLIRDVGPWNGSSELALEALVEFFTVGEAPSAEGYVSAILKSCQYILEDDKTSLNLLRYILRLLSLISLKYVSCFRPNFVDIVDLLLGWGLIPDLSESDRRVIMETFLQFRTHWVSNIQFSIGLLSKFLGDMEVLIQDVGINTPEHLARFLALFSCFSTVLQATTSESVEGKPFEEMRESLKQIVPQLLRCLGMVDNYFGEHWIGDLWRCLTLIAGIMKESFSDFYPAVISIFFQTIKALPSYQLPEILIANLKLLCLQKSRLLPSSVKLVLQLSFPFSMLRLNMSYHVVGNLASTYIFLLQHDSHAVISQAITSLTEELGLLVSLLRRNSSNAKDNEDIHVGCVADSLTDLSDSELIALIKFDLKLLSGCLTECSDSKLSKDADFYLEISKKLALFFITNLSPFQCPIQCFLELQVLVVRTLSKLTEFELVRRLSMVKYYDKMVSNDIDDERKGELGANTDQAFFINQCLMNCSIHIVRALSSSMPLAVKLEALEWIGGICRAALAVNKDSDVVSCSKPLNLFIIGDHLLFAIKDASSDRDHKVRITVATIFERLLQSRVINPGCFYLIANVALERLGDPEAAIKSSYARVLSIVLPLTFYLYGIFEDSSILRKSGLVTTGRKHNFNWKQLLALKQFPQQLHSQQLVSILSYISHRWKVPTSSWIHRLVPRCRTTDDNTSPQHEEREGIDESTAWLDDEVDRTILDRICPVNNLAAVWWGINEAARYCVALRLRTNYGGPTQTFASLERMLLDVSHILVLEKDQTDGSSNVQVSNAHLLPMRLLLDFVESLKKNVYNAYEGSSILPSATRQSSLFFKANKKVCEEWFSRISEPMLNAGLAMQYYGAVIHYGVLRLQELHDLMLALKDEKQGTSESYNKYRAKLAADLLKILRHITLALCRCHEAESLVGLQNWVMFKFSSLLTQENHINQFSWIGGLVYQSQGKYEKAAAHFSHLLQSEDALSCLGSEGIQFIIARIIENYTSLSDWKSLEIWLSELQAIRAMHTGKAYSGALTAAGNEINAVHALSHFDEGDSQSAWAYLDLTPKSSSELTLDPRLSLERSEYMLLRGMIQKDEKMANIPELIEKSKLMIDEMLSAAPLDGLPEATPYATQLHCIFAFEEGNYTDCQQKVKQLSPMVNSLSQVLHLPINKINQDPSLWLKLFRVYRNITPTSQVTMLFCQRLASLARKQGNFLLAGRLNQYLRNNITMFPNREFSDSVSTFLQYESILLSYSQGRQEEAFTGLWLMLRDCIISQGTIISTAKSCKVMMAKACLKLDTWLRKETSSANLKNILNKIHADFFEHGMEDLSIDRSGISSSTVPGSASMAIVEEVSGTAIKISCQLCPTLCKTWFTYASWCHSQATSCLISNEKFSQSPALSTILVPELSANRTNLTEEEIFNVRAIITDFFQEFEHKKVKIDDDKMVLFTDENEFILDSCVSQTIHLITSSTGGAATENSTVECPSALASHLQTLLLANSRKQKQDVSSYVNKLVDIWWMLRQRRVSLFKHAVHGYLQYLSYSSSQTQEHNHPNSHTYHVREKTKICTLRATLYILQILLNFGVELRETIEHGLASGPLLPWQELTPQLFARLSSHPHQEIRIQLERLLMMLAKISPWSIVYLILVDINNSEGEPPEELQRIYDCLFKIYPYLIKDVQLVISELGGMTVLWEEQWLSTLQDIHSDVSRRINMLKEEAKRISDNPTLSHIEKNKINAAKYSAVMTPVIVALERRLASTSREPETSHEEWFQKEYGAQLKSAILSLKTPPVSLSALGEVWQPFSVIAESLANYQKTPIVSLKEVAPRLAKLSSSEVPMPGLEKQISVLDRSCIVDPQGLVTISSFCDKMSILPTKTKPKKLIVLGSNGQKYTYLLKGREDLRLDARIMQLLQAVNSFLCSSPYISSSTEIRYYSVTPISGRAGLIQWVENVTSMYSVYKSWMNRVHAAKLSASTPGNVNNTVPPIPRPSDMFYGKIIPALKQKGVKKVISRRDWPHDVKRSVLLELMKETPKQLLYQEIWCASEGFNAFRSKLKRFSGSVAAMSMVGHILGLGDRHLDNILVDFCTGDVVHIDYNVCFDKGRRLKIPEIVPFRLTQIIETALGLTGTEGTFKINSEAILGVMRNNKDVILMMLDVFVWDPLVEWTRGDMHDEATIGGEEKKGMELAVSLSLFASRFQEIRFPLQEHHDLLISSLPAVKSRLEKLLGILNEHEIISAVFCHADEERSDLLHREASAKSLLADATSISENALSTFEVHCHEFAHAKSAAADKAQELLKWMEQHGRILDALRIGSIPKLQTLVKLSSMEEALSLTSAIAIAGVPLTIVPEPTKVQCYDLDKEVYRLTSELDNGLCHALDSLQEYALALQRVLPLNYVKSSPVSGWAQILQLSVSNLSPDILSVTRSQATELITKIQGDCYDSVQERYQELMLNIERYATDIEKLSNECSELLNSIGPDVESRSKEGLLSALSRYIQSMGYSGNQNDWSFVGLIKSKNEGRNDIELEEINNMIKNEVFSVLNKAAGVLFEEVKLRVHETCHNPLGIVSTSGHDGFPSNSAMVFCQFEEQIEKSALIAGLLIELQPLMSSELSSFSEDAINSLEGNWASKFRSSTQLCRTLIEQILEVVLPEMITFVISYHSEIIEVFGSISQIRDSIDMALEQLVEIESERISLLELETNYTAKVRLITEQKHALEIAAARGRDHLSWEEAEELASEEEACRKQLEKLQQTWNQKDTRTSFLEKSKASLKLSLIASERHLSTLINMENEEDGDSHIRRSKILLAMLVSPFSELELFDQQLASYVALTSDSSGSFLPETPCFSSPESLWKIASLIKANSFFMWKVGVINALLDSCRRNISSFVDLNLSFDQLYYVLKKKVEVQLQADIVQYLGKRVAPIFLACLERKSRQLLTLAETNMKSSFSQTRKDTESEKKVQKMLEDYSHTHETARATRSAASLLQRQVKELCGSLYNNALESVQMEWLYDQRLPYLCRQRAISSNILGRDELSPIILNINRAKLLEKLQSAMSLISRSLECLQDCERTSFSAEAQLERAMGWACAGANVGNSGSTVLKSSGIPSEFHDHLMRRRQFLWAAQEQASNIMSICTPIMEFEASRDGLFRIPGETASSHITNGRAWQQSYMNALTRLDITYHSFMRSEQEWKLAKSNTEEAAEHLFSVTSELCVASKKAKSASDDLKDNITTMRDCAREACTSLSAFSSASKGYNVLTAECGSMLEEVLAITEDVHDVYSFGKEAVKVRGTLVENLSKATTILLPLEASLSADFAAMEDAIAREKETSVGILQICRQAICQVYVVRIQDCCQSLRTLVHIISSCSEELCSTMIRLARTASAHAGNLHKALEGLGESGFLGSQGSVLSREEPASGSISYGNRGPTITQDNQIQSSLDMGVREPLQTEEWLSPPYGIYSSSTESSTTSDKTDFFENYDSTEPFYSGLNASGSSEDSNMDTKKDENFTFIYLKSEPAKSENIINITSPDFPSDTSTHEQSLPISTENAIISDPESSRLAVKVLPENATPVAFKKAIAMTCHKGKDQVANLDVSASRATRDKNAYAVSVLKRVEMKLEGRENDASRPMSIEEQVDHLIKQATSVDNLCNMYEGWTPWI